MAGRCEAPDQGATATLIVLSDKAYRIQTNFHRCSDFKPLWTVVDSFPLASFPYWFDFQRRFHLVSFQAGQPGLPDSLDGGRECISARFRHRDPSEPGDSTARLDFARPQ